MRSWISTLFEAALFRSSAFDRLLARRDVFFQGFLIVVAVSLAVGLPTLIGDFVHSVQPAAAIPSTDAVMSEIDRVMTRLGPFMGNIPDELRKQLLAQVAENVAFGMEMARKVAELRAPLPSPVGEVFQSAGAWLSAPFADAGLPLTAATLGTWLGYGVWVMLVAKLLGGRGTLAGFLGLSAIFAVPHLLAFFAFVPVLGALLGIVAFLWGIALYVKATAVSHQIDSGRAFLAVVSPGLVVGLLGLLAVAITALLVGVGIAGQ